MKISEIVSAIATPMYSTARRIRARSTISLSGLERSEPHIPAELRRARDVPVRARERVQPNHHLGIVRLENGGAQDGENLLFVDGRKAYSLQVAQHAGRGGDADVFDGPQVDGDSRQTMRHAPAR